jgi:hypothetical protein
MPKRYRAVETPFDPSSMALMPVRRRTNFGPFGNAAECGPDAAMDGLFAGGESDWEDGEAGAFVPGGLMDPASRFFVKNLSNLYGDKEQSDRIRVHTSDEDEDADSTATDSASAGGNGDGRPLSSSTRPLLPWRSGSVNSSRAGSPLQGSRIRTVDEQQVDTPGEESDTNVKIREIVDDDMEEDVEMVRGGVVSDLLEEEDEMMPVGAGHRASFGGPAGAGMPFDWPRFGGGGQNYFPRF